MITHTTYAQTMVNKLVQQGELTSERIKQAFLTVPRHLFIHHYYKREGQQFVLQHADADTDAWYRQVYDDAYFFTKINEYGHGISSSSQPGIMAPMLEYLDVQPGHRVLEIGTGTGYNACLLATLTEDPRRVTTIDIHADLIAQAATRIEQVVGPGMHVLVADGTSGYQEHAPYDRIIVTAASSIVTSAWYEQLAPEGILVCVLQSPRSGAGGVLRAVKQESHLRGQILHGASFMALNNAYEHRPRFISTSQPWKERFQVSRAYIDLDLIDDVDFHFYWSFLYPEHAKMFQTIEGQEQMYTLLTTDTKLAGYVSCSGSTIALHGHYGFLHWQRLLQAFTMWHAMKQPCITDYAFFMDGKSQRLFIQRDEIVFYPFAESAGFDRNSSGYFT